MFDVDGTICFDGQTIEPDILDALRLLRTCARLVFASARPIRDLLPVLPADLHECTLLGGNGAFVRDHGAIDVIGIAPESRVALDELIDRRGLRVLIDGDWNYHFTGDPAHRIHRQVDAGHLARNVARDEIPTYSKVVLFTTDPEVLEELRCLGLSWHEHGAEGLVDIAPVGITKHAALARIGVADGSYIAFGNDSNDVTMLRGAAVGYCVGDHEALAFADHHIERGEVAATIAALARQRLRPQEPGGF